jgi:aryl-alcohol dehydrogenase-like predicted oxidoreductase
MGTWAWGDRFYWGYGRSYSEADLQAAFRAALAAGINLFDTAEVYGPGRSERLLGQFTRGAVQPPVVASKFAPLPWRLRRGSLLRALRGSLKRLGMESLGLYQIHWPLPHVSVETWMGGLAEAAEQGLTSAVGVSNYNVDQMRRAHSALAKRGVPLASNQVEFSLLQRKPERNGLLKACRELGITLIAYSPLGQGLLTGKYTPDKPPPGVRGRRYGQRRLVQIGPLIALLQEIGGAHGGKTTVQVALNWIICKGAVPIPGAKNARQAQENAGALGWRLTDEQIAALDTVSQIR